MRIRIHLRLIVGAIVLGFLHNAAFGAPATSKPVRVKIGVQVQGNVADDPKQGSLTSPPDFSGQVIYASTINIWPFRRYLVLNQVPGRTGGQANTTTFPLEENEKTTDWLYDPQFSPDGQYVLFKLGNLHERYGTFDLLLWHLKTGQVRRVAELSYPFSLWSPDGSYIAYIRGGDLEGHPGTSGLQLCTYNLKTFQEHLIVKNDAVRGGVGWTPQNTLLYSAFVNPKSKDSKSNDDEAKAVSLTRPNIYEIKAEGGDAKLVVLDGYRPSCSPDGKRIVFFGSEDPGRPGSLSSRWWENPYYAAVSVSDRDGNNRRALNREQRTYPVIQWLPDSQGFLTIKTTRQGNTIEGRIQEWNATSGQGKSVGVLRLRDDQNFIDGGPFPFFRPLSVVAGHLLPVVTQEYRTSGDVLLTRLDSLKTVDLKTGSVSTVIELKDATGLDYLATPEMK